MPLRVLSLGAGVQSSTLALMAAAGEITPMPDCAIFADTHWEPAAVYAHLETLKAQLPFPVYTVTAGNIREDAVRQINTTGQRFAAIPWFVRHPDGTEGMGRRQCTNEYKLKPIRRQIRALMEQAGAERAEQWMGITVDEAHRMKDSGVQYLRNEYPLVRRSMTRHDCLRWLERHGWTAPRSACVGCPFRSDAEWRALTEREFQDACAVDEAIRWSGTGRRQQFMHASRQPLDQVDFSTLEDHGQQRLWGNECEGMCGV